MFCAIEPSVLLRETPGTEQLLTHYANARRDTGGMVGAGILVLGVECTALRTEIRVQIDRSSAMIALMHRIDRLRQRFHEENVALLAEDPLIGIFRAARRTDLHREK